MMIGTLQMELYIPEAFSLKEKRFVLQSLKNKIRSTFNVSIAEVDFQDKWQRALMAVACVSIDRRYIDSVFAKIMNTISSEDRVEIMNQRVEVF